jgi:hypothetical protein
VQGLIVPMEVCGLSILDGGAGTSSVMDNGRGLEPGLVGGGSGRPRRRDGAIAPPNKVVRPTAGTEGWRRWSADGKGDQWMWGGRRPGLTM